MSSSILQEGHHRLEQRSADRSHCFCHSETMIQCLPAGLHLIRHAAWRTLERGGQFVLLGSAPDPKIQAGLPFLLS